MGLQEFLFAVKIYSSSINQLPDGVMISDNRYKLPSSVGPY